MYNVETIELDNSVTPAEANECILSTYCGKVDPQRAEGHPGGSVWLTMKLMLASFKNPLVCQEF